MKRVLLIFLALLVAAQPVLADQVTFKAGIVFPNVPRFATRTAVYLNLLVDASGKKAAAVIYAPKSGTVAKIGWRTGTVTASTSTDVRLETVDTTSGDPSGTLWATNTNGTEATVASNTWYATTLTAGASVTKGDLLAVVIAPSGTPNYNVSTGDSGGGLSINFPYVDLYTTSWAKTSVAPVVALEYNDGSYEPIPGTLPASNYSSPAFNSGSTPDEKGLHFKFAFPVRVTGFCAAFEQDTDTTFKLYDSDGATVLASVSVDSNARAAVSHSFFCHYFTTTHTLAKDTFYRLTAVPSSTTNCTMAEITVASVAAMDAWEGGQNLHMTERTDGGAWSQTTTKRPLISLVIDGLDNGAGSGAGSGAIPAVIPY